MDSSPAKGNSMSGGSEPTLDPATSAGSDTLSETAESEVSQTFSSFVAEASQIKEFISSLTAVEQNARRVCVIIDKYQEQPQLLDPHLESMIQPLVEHLRDGASLSPSQLYSICSVLYVIAKVRGFKTVIKFFPHNVSDLEPCLDLLSAQDVSDHERWEIRYILLLWLAILVIIPFSLETVDSNLKTAQTASDTAEHITLIDRIVNVCKQCLSEASKTRDAAAYVLAQLLTRPDMEESTLVVFLHWSMAQLSASTSNQFLITGVQSALAHIFKHGARQSMLDKIPIVVGILHEEAAASGRSSLQRLYNCKLAQRLGLTYLPARVAPWRYNRGHRSLLDNLRGKTSASAPASAAAAGSAAAAEEEEAEEEDGFVPVEIDYVVDLLLKALQDRDTVVRWSAAKGLGRITARLPKHLGDEVVSAVMDCFGSELEVNAWHGGCLALAELARRGLLLPARLEGVVPVTLRALRMDLRQGSASVGSHVRDAACYVCWAFARAYAPAVMAPHVAAMAPGLLTLALLDREVNCRRAACAAFQENVGRQGAFPHGIELVTKVDYFTVGSRGHAFLELCPLVAQLAEYRPALLEHLARRQLRHWDVGIRELASKALGRVVALDAAATLREEGVLAELLKSALAPDVATRHGATMAVAEVVMGLRGAGGVGERWQGAVAGLVPAIEKARLFRGRGGEVMRGACCRVLEAMAWGGVALSGKEAQKLVEGCSDHLKHPTEPISRAAAAAVGALSRGCFGGVGAAWQGALVRKYVAQAEKDANPAARRGFALGVGALAGATLQLGLAEVVSGLVRAATVLEESAEERDAAARRNAVQGLVQAAREVGLGACYEGEGPGLTRAMVEEVVGGLLAAVEDYCVDNRGDVGSWVRMAAMEGMGELCLMACAADARAGVLGAAGAVWSEDYSCRVAQALVKQLSEKIDGVRACAGAVLARILSTPPPTTPSRSPSKATPAAGVSSPGASASPPVQVPFVPDRDALEAAVGGAGSAAGVDWRAPSAAYPRVVALLRSETYREAALAGLVVSVGGISESTVKHSWGSLLHSLQAEEGARRAEEVAEGVLALLRASKGVDRVVVPAMRAAHLLLSNGCMDGLDPATSGVPVGLLEAVQAEMRGSKDVAKLQAGVSVAAALLQYPAAHVRGPALQTLLAMLCHRYPRVRKQAGETVYLQLLTHEGLVPDEHMESATRLLGETDWTADVASLRPIRDELYPAFGVTRADTPAVALQVRSSKAQVEDQGYKDLVKEMHY